MTDAFFLQPTAMVSRCPQCGLELFASDAGKCPACTSCPNCEAECLQVSETVNCCECRNVEPCQTCSDRRDREAENAHERFLSRYYGGEVSTIQEQYEKAFE